MHSGLALSLFSLGMLLLNGPTDLVLRTAGAEGLKRFSSCPESNLPRTVARRKSKRLAVRVTRPPCQTPTGAGPRRAGLGLTCDLKPISTARVARIASFTLARRRPNPYIGRDETLQFDSASHGGRDVCPAPVALRTDDPRPIESLECRAGFHGLD